MIEGYEITISAAYNDKDVADCSLILFTLSGTYAANYNVVMEVGGNVVNHTNASTSTVYKYAASIYYKGIDISAFAPSLMK